MILIAETICRLIQPIRYMPIIKEIARYNIELVGYKIINQLRQVL